MAENAKIERSQKEFLKALKATCSQLKEPIMKETVNYHVTLIPYANTVRDN